ncbi:MAG: hydroxyacylglutathione hydrolase [Pseudomonadota bacterium]
MVGHLEIVQLPVLHDNYIYLIHEPGSGATAVVDPAVPDVPLQAAAERGWTITHILNTHHHMDHVGGNMAIKEATGCTIVGPGPDNERIPGIDVQVNDGDVFSFGEAQADIFFTPGHTRGHIVYWFSQDAALFCGDTLFAMGCGRLFEGSPEQMWTSLQKLLALPDDARVFCAHEYTQANGAFALSVEPQNAALQARMEHVKALRVQGLPTVPSTMGDEKETNPFLRPTSVHLRETIGLPSASDVDVFAKTRALKDQF